MNIKPRIQTPDMPPIGRSVFLCGPTPRSESVPSWRPEAIRLFERSFFDGTLFVPERPDWKTMTTYTDQIGWELDGIERAGVVMFWVPRDMATMPALTTNVEFGWCMSRFPEKVVYGRPECAPHTRYLDYLYGKQTGRTPQDDLHMTVLEAIQKCREL